MLQEGSENMFLAKEVVKEKVKSIILDDADNDIIFVVANKGLGKTKLLHEIYGDSSFDKNLIMVDGSKIISNVSNLKKCFADGITKFVSLHNSFLVRSKLCKEIRSYISFSEAIETVFVNRRKVKNSPIARVLCSLPLNRLKEIYVMLAEKTPLIIVSSVMILSNEETDYLSELNNDNLEAFGARVTFVIAVRTNPKNLDLMYRIIETKIKRVWILPLLPEISHIPDDKDPRSLASISISDIGEICTLQDLHNKVCSNQVYFEMHDIIRVIQNRYNDPKNVYILANQEISLSNYQYLTEITSKLYKNQPEVYERRIMLPYDGKILWLDALSYYLALQMGIDEAISQTQQFFLMLISAISTNSIDFCYWKPKRNTFGLFIKEAAQNQNNALAAGFAKYYSDFASLVKLFFQKNAYNNQTYQDTLVAIQVLDRVLIEFSDVNIEAIGRMYEDTQTCSILDIGLETICRFLRLPESDTVLSEDTEIKIRKFLHIALSAAYKWQDETLIDEIVSLEMAIKSRIKSDGLKIPFSKLTIDSSPKTIYRYFIQQLKENGLEIGDVIMPKKTIFLSYAQSNGTIADQVDNGLQTLGYDVKRDIREVHKWDNLKEFMKSIRKEDYVVFLVSDSFLHRDKCLYEIMQFNKDESYKNRAFPIAVLFSSEEKSQREKERKCTSMFQFEYIKEIILFWQDRAAALDNDLNQLGHENAVELNAIYREIKNMAQEASKFLYKYFDEELIATIDPDNPKFDDLVKDIDKLIQPSIGDDNL